MKQICGDCLHYNACAAWNIGSLANTDAGSCVNYTPAADVVKVVRCKDCLHCMEYTPEYKKDGYYGTCYRLLFPIFDGNDVPVKENDYCSYGKRKEG